MLVGLMSDTHDRIPAVQELLRQMAEAGVGFVLHAGDYCSPFALAPFHDLNMAMAGVFGRNDGDPQGIRAYASRGLGVEIYDSPHSVSLGGHRLLLVHDIGEVNQRSIESHTFVVHGCAHQQELKERGDVLIVNPGEACGWLYGQPAAAILDLRTRRVQFLKLTGPEWQT